MTTTRIYLANIVGSGTDEDPFYSVLDDYMTYYSKNRRIFGGEGVMWMMANVKAASHVAMLADSRMFAMPDFALDTAVANMGPGDMDALSIALTDHGVPTSLLATATTFRDVVRGIGEHLIGQAWDPTQFLAI